MKTTVPILFYNFFHNGDLFHSKAFIREIINNIPVPIYYAHGNHPKVLMDLNLNQIRLQQAMPMHSDKVIAAENLCLVNTWIGAYFKSGVPGHKEGSCTLGFTYGMYEYIYEQLNEIYGCNLKLNSNKAEYFSTIDFDKFDLSKINQYLNEDRNRKILISNGPAMSGQSSYNDNMQNVVENLAISYDDITFICTSKFNTNRSNILFTNDITQQSECDLNEISYLSKFCDIIVGRSSGPFCFSCIKENIDDECKTFICVGNSIRDCYQYNIETNSKFIFEQFSSEENFLNTIKTEISGL